MKEFCIDTWTRVLTEQVAVVGCRRWLNISLDTILVSCYSFQWWQTTLLTGRIDSTILVILAEPIGVLLYLISIASLWNHYWVITDSLLSLLHCYGFITVSLLYHYCNYYISTVTKLYCSISHITIRNVTYLQSHHPVVIELLL